MCFERASGMRYRLCGCVDILEVEFVDCLLPSCRQSICHPDDCQGILCPCTISLGPRVLTVKPPVNRRCEKCEAKQSLAPLPTTKARRFRHKRDTRDRHPARQTCEPVRELPKPKTTKTSIKDVDRPKTKSTRRPLGESNRVSTTTASPVVLQTPGTVPSMRPSLLPPRPRNPHPPSSTSSSASSGTRPPASKVIPIPNHLPPPPPTTPSSVFSLPVLEIPSKTPSRKTSSTLSSLGSAMSKSGTTRYPLPEIPWPSTAAQTPAGTSPEGTTYFVPLDPLGTPHPRHYVPDSPHSSASSSSRWRTATASSTDSRPASDLDSSIGSESKQRTSRTWSWKRTGLSRPMHASQPLEPLPLPPTPAPPPSERRSTFTSESTRPRVVAPPFISQPSSPRTSSSAQSSPMPLSPTPKRPKLGWTASTLMAVLPKVPSRPFSQSTRDASPVLVQHPITPPSPELLDDLKPRPRRSFLRNPWSKYGDPPVRPRHVGITSVVPLRERLLRRPVPSHSSVLRARPSCHVDSCAGLNRPTTTLSSIAPWCLRLISKPNGFATYPHHRRTPNVIPTSPSQASGRVVVEMCCTPLLKVRARPRRASSWPRKDSIERLPTCSSLGRACSYNASMP